MEYKARHDLHIARRLWHFGGVMFVFFLYNYLDQAQAVTTSLTVSLIMVTTDWARLRIEKLGRFFRWLFGPVLRESELHQLTASTAMVIGLTIVICVFPRPVTGLTLLFLAVADPLASLVGILYGKDKLVGNKSLQGTLAAFASCFILSYVYLARQGLMEERPFIVCTLAGLIGAISELIPIFKLDDNFVFPVLSATLLTGLFYLFGGL
ncbi:MAG: diacylglycerol/polyprenol kinase family protein [Bdellovibrionales bacterium]